MANQQLHKRFTNEQVRDIVGKYVQKQIRAKEACKYLGIGRTRLHQLTTTYRQNPDKLTLAYTRTVPTREVAKSVKGHILTELKFEKEKIIDNPSVPTTRYNYSYIRNLLWDKYQLQVSPPTLISLAGPDDFWRLR